MHDPVVRTYDFKNYVHTLGSIILTGFDEEGITISRENDMFSRKSGVDATERSNMNNFDLTITVNILKTNPLNDILSALHNLDSTTNAGKVPWLTKDLNGLSLTVALSAWIVKAPDMVNKKESESNVWLIHTGPSAKFDGGSIL